MPGNYSHTTRTDGTVLTASIYNTDHQNHIDNNTPAGVDDHSSSAVQMGVTTDPGESGSESLATALSGELERLRFAILDIKSVLGFTAPKWYSTPTGQISQSVVPTIIPPGTIMLFQQTSAPTGWTKLITHNNKALRVVSGTASSGGSQTFSSVFAAGLSTGSTALTIAQLPAHAHSVSGTTAVGSVDHSHTFSGATGTVSADHSHHIGAYESSNEAAGYGLTLSGTFQNRVMVNVAYATSQNTDGISSNHTHSFSGTTSGFNTNHDHGFAATSSSVGSNSTHNHSLNLDIQFVDIILASKN